MSSADKMSARRMNTPPGRSRTPPSPEAIAIVIKLIVKLLRVRMRFRVQDHEIRTNALRPPVPVCHEQLPDAGQHRPTARIVANTIGQSPEIP